MRVVHVSTYEAFGGAARSAHRLHDGLRSIGIDSVMLVEQSEATDPTVVKFKPATDLVSRLRRKVRHETIRRSFQRYAVRRPKGLDVFSDDRSRYGREVIEQLPACDVVNVHWIASFVDYESFFRAVPRCVPVVWTLHDMNLFTGGCHYTMGCDRHRLGCGACPQLGSDDRWDLSHRVFDRKRRLFDRVSPKRLHLVAPSRWLADEARNSVLGRRFEISVIPYGLDLSVFAPRDRHTAREVLGVASDAKVILFVAQDVENERKGNRLLQEAVNQLGPEASGILLVSVGRGAGVSAGRIPCAGISQVGDDRLLSFVYSAADVFVIPSRQDNLPNTVLEAMACGVPVIGFQLGGVTDMVRSGVTGALVRPFDTRALAAEIRGLLDNPDRRKAMAANSRRIAEEEYALGLQARRYTEIYDGMVRLQA